MSKGVLLYAYNNQELDYVKMALLVTALIQKHLKIPVSLVTDKVSYEYAEKNYPEQLEDKFDKVVFSERDYDFNQGNKRILSDTSFNSKAVPFYNCDRYTAFELSPYDETITMDSDYLVFSDILNLCWGSKPSFMICDSSREIYEDRNPKLKYIADFSVPLYWTTVMYFKKDVFSEQIFKIVEHIRHNWDYYRAAYHIHAPLYRNDFAFSIAIHMMNGFSKNHLVSNLPCKKILKTFGQDDIHSLNENGMIAYVEKPKWPGHYILQKIDTDIHVMNKWALLRHADGVLK